MALLDVDAGTITPRYVEFIEGKKQEAKGNYGTSFTLTLDTAAAAARPGSRRDQRAALGPPCQGLTAGQTYGVQAVVRAQYPANAVRLYVDRNQDGDFGEPVLTVPQCSASQQVRQSARWQYQLVPCTWYTYCDHPGVLFCTESPDNGSATPTGQTSGQVETWTWIGRCVDGQPVPDRCSALT